MVGGARAVVDCHCDVRSFNAVTPQNSRLAADLPTMSYAGCNRAQPKRSPPAASRKTRLRSVDTAMGLIDVSKSRSAVASPLRATGDGLFLFHLLRRASAGEPLRMLVSLPAKIGNSLTAQEREVALNSRRDNST